MFSAKLNLLIFFSLLAFVSCNDPLKNSIKDKLPDEVILLKEEKDSSFNNFYNEVRLLVDSVYSKGRIKDIESIKYSDLYSLNQYFKDKREELNTEENISKWKTIYQKDINRFESDSIRYSGYIKRNNYSKYIAFEPIRIYNERDWLGLEKPIFEIKVIPLNNEIIRKVGGYVSIIDKNKKYDDFYNYTQGALFISEKLITKESIIKAQEFNSTNNNLYNFVNIPIHIIKQKYNIDIKVIELIVNDKYVDVELDSVPYYMKEYLAGHIYLYKNEYIKKNINSNHKSFQEYLNETIINSMTKSQKEIYNFYIIGYKEFYK